MNKRNVILTSVAIFGVIATAGTVGWGTLKADEILKSSRSSISKIKSAYPYYIPAAICGAGTIAAMVTNSYLNYKEVAAISATAAYAFKNRKILGDKIREIVPEEELKKVKEALALKTVKDEPPFNLESVEITGNGDLLCLDGYSGRWFRSSEEAVAEAERQLNELFETNKYVCLNDFYKLLGIEETHFGYQFGWVNDPDWYGASVEFENTVIDNYKTPTGVCRGEPVLVIDLYDYPMECWQEV